MQYSAVRYATTKRARLLEQLGVVVRTLRNEQGLTLKALARVAGVSERFLAQLEAGDGNISVARLEDVAEALGATGAELLTRATQKKSEGEAPRAAVAFVGLRGAGKSSIGKAVATKLGVPFIELDEEIVREAQMTLSTIFEIHGEAYYRAMERDVLRRFLDTNKPLVIATGGSLVTDPETWGLLKRRAKTIWLKATPREHWDRVVSQGDVRPMRGRPKAMNELKQLLTSRTPLYEEATTTIETSGRTPKEIAEEIVRSRNAI
jgi:XRE family transcriptional regulator, aerobic/anaerobic benzoate catabolism transcriptional regulator